MADGEPVRTEARWADITSATTAAHTALHDTPDASYVTIIDTKHEAAVRVAER